MITIEFQDLRLPDDPAPEAIGSWAEGYLKFRVGDILILNESDYLVVEIAGLFSRWLDRGSVFPVSFTSQDIEEEPVLEFVGGQKEGEIEVASGVSGLAVSVSERELTDAVRRFVSEVKEAVDARYGKGKFNRIATNRWVR